MQTLDVRSGTGELMIIATGCAHPPVVINQDTGISTVLRPAHIDHRLLGHWVTVMDGIARTTPGAFWGEMAIAPETGAVRLHLIEGTEVTSCTVRRKPEPAAEAQPRARSGNRRTARAHKDDAQ
jgi:hypothetical protein